MHQRPKVKTHTQLHLLTSYLLIQNTFYQVLARSDLKTCISLFLMHVCVWIRKQEDDLEENHIHKPEVLNIFQNIFQSIFQCCAKTNTPPKLILLACAFLKK